MRKKTQEVLDILAQKEARLSELQSESAFAVKVVEDTIGNLEAVNADIQSTKEEIDTYIERLNATRSSLASTYTKNQKVMQNFKQLLCVE